MKTQTVTIKKLAIVILTIAVIIEVGYLFWLLGQPDSEPHQPSVLSVPAEK